MAALTRPTQFADRVFASGATGLTAPNTIPNTKSTLGQISFNEGFPAETGADPTGGGAYFDGKDMQGLIKYLHSYVHFYCTGGGRPRFNASFASSVGGYPIGTILQTDDGLSEYRAITLNSNNFNTTPSVIGVDWSPYAGSALRRGEVTKVDESYSSGVSAGNSIASSGATNNHRNLINITNTGLGANTINGVTKNVVLEAGTYSVTGYTTGYLTGVTAAWLRNASTLVRLTDITPVDISTGQMTVPIIGLFSLATQSEVEVRQYTQSAITNGLGVAEISSTSHTFTELIFTRVA